MIGVQNVQRLPVSIHAEVSVGDSHVWRWVRAIWGHPYKDVLVDDLQCWAIQLTDYFCSSIGWLLFHLGWRCSRSGSEILFGELPTSGAKTCWQSLHYVCRSLTKESSTQKKRYHLQKHSSIQKLCSAPNPLLFERKIKSYSKLKIKKIKQTSRM